MSIEDFRLLDDLETGVSSATLGRRNVRREACHLWPVLISPGQRCGEEGRRNISCSGESPLKIQVDSLQLGHVITKIRSPRKMRRMRNIVFIFLSDDSHTVTSDNSVNRGRPTLNTTLTLSSTCCYYHLSVRRPEDLSIRPQYRGLDKDPKYFMV